MEDVFKLLEDRLTEAPVVGDLTDEDMKALAESDAEFARGDFTVAIESVQNRVAAEG